MALHQVPQRLARENLDRVVARNEPEDNILLLAVMAWRRRRRLRQQQERMPKRWQVKPWIARRPMHGAYYTLFEELDRECEQDYRSYLRMDRNLFAYILMRIEPRITKDPRLVHMNKAIFAFIFTPQTLLFSDFLTKKY